MVTKNQLDASYKYTFDLAIELLTQTARKVMVDNPKPIEYVQGVGTWFFVTKKGNFETESDACRPIFEIMDRYDEYLHLTGHPMRFTKDGSVINDW